MTYLELKAAYRAALVAFAADAERPNLLDDDIWTALYDRDYNEPMFNSPVPKGIVELAALIVDNPTIGDQETWEPSAETITVWDAMSNGVHQQLREDLHADWLTIKAEALVKP